MKPLLQMRGIVKSFPGVQALAGVDFTLAAGEVHVLLGENGAGKSTLMKVLTGVYAADEGEVRLDGVVVRPRSVLDAQRLGLVMVMQEFNLIPDLTVAENVVLVNRPEGPLLARVRRAEMEARAREILARLGLEVAPGELVRRLSVAEKQMVEIAKALSLSARVLVLDEPTAALSEAEARRLFELMRGLTAEGLGIVYISHRFEEIYAVGDRVTVLRDGQWVATHVLAEVSRPELLREMAGRELNELYPRSRVERGPEALAVAGLSSESRVREANLTLHQGEVLGLGGLMGAGRTELAKAIFGARPISGGQVRVAGRPARIQAPADAMALGVAYCSEDRKDEGLFLDRSVAFNICITDLRQVLTRGLVSAAKESARGREFIDRLQLKPPDPERKVRTLSGGAQQKVMLAKWLHIAPRVLIMDEPTRGIDVGAKVEIYRLLDRFVAGGGAVLLISSDLPELIALSDRLLVMHEGRIAGECLPPFAPERIMALATGQSVACPG
jgi:ribose transport system ATP-binding protein